MAAPLGTLTWMTRTQLETLRTEMLARLTSGKRTSLSGGAKSASFGIPANSFEEIQQVMVEIKYALNRLSRDRHVRAATVYADFRLEKPYGYRGTFYNP